MARSSVEAEFRAMALSICELLWIRIILSDLKIIIEGPMILYCENKAALSITHNLVNMTGLSMLKLTDISSKKSLTQDIFVFHMFLQVVN